MFAGAYGQVTMSPDGCGAVKRAPLFDHHPYNNLCGCNLNEAIFAATLTQRHVNGVIKVHEVSTEGNALRITMDKGQRTLDKFILETSFQGRIKEIWDIFHDLVCGLYNLHNIGIIHCDFKPANVVMMPDGCARIIDFGSARLYKRAVCKADLDIWCTYAFCAPEALHPDYKKPTPAIDAYSLGATLFYYIYKGYLYDSWKCETKQEAWEEHASGRVLQRIPRKCPEYVPEEIFNAMIGLLNPDPITRTTITEIFDTFFYHPRDDRNKYVILDPPSPVTSPRKVRDKAIDYLYTLSGPKKECFGLAVNIMDRFEVEVKRTCTFGELKTIWTIAELTLYPDIDAFVTNKHAKRMLDVFNALNFRIYADTPDWLLLDRHEHPIVDYEVLKQVLKESEGITQHAVELYLTKRDYMVISDDDNDM